MIRKKVLLQGIKCVTGDVEKLATLLTLAVIVASVMSMHVLAYIDKAGLDASTMYFSTRPSSTILSS